MRIRKIARGRTGDGRGRWSNTITEALGTDDKDRWRGGEEAVKGRLVLS